MRRKVVAAALILVAALALLGHQLLPGGWRCLAGNVRARWLDDWTCPGVGLLKVTPDEQVHIRAYGYATPAMQQHVTADTPYDIASLSKQFTGLAIATLIERGRLGLSDPVTAHVPELGRPDITIANLLYHTSGLPEYSWMCGEGRKVTDADVLRFARDAEPDFDPGDDYEYSNTGYVILAIVVERITGVPFARWLKENVFVPLGMTRTTFHDARVEGLAQPFVKPLEPLGGCDGVRGDGGIVTTLGDYARWLLELSSPTLVTPATLRLMTTPGRLDDGTPIGYAFGWVVTREEIQHEGAWNGYRAVVGKDLETGEWRAVFTSYALYDVTRILDVF